MFPSARTFRHPLATLVRQRVYQIACGYEDRYAFTQLPAIPVDTCGKRS